MKNGVLPTTAGEPGFEYEPGLIAPVIMMFVVAPPHLPASAVRGGEDAAAVHHWATQSPIRRDDPGTRAY